MKNLIAPIAVLWLAAAGSICGGTLSQQRFAATIQKTVSIGYLLYLPEQCAVATNRAWPLILFLHGSGARGSDLARVKIYGPPMIAETASNFPLVVVAPQCPAEQWWDADVLHALVQQVVVTHRIDTKRLYLTGLSMGGFGAWSMAMAYPDLFAALAPICGGGDTNAVVVLRHVPTWVFHGTDDKVVPIRKSEEMVTALQRAGGTVRFTRYEKTGHDAWAKAYGDADLFTWFLQQRR